MAEKKPMVVYAASYDSVSAALTDLDAIEQLHKDEMIGAVFGWGHLSGWEPAGTATGVRPAPG
jgi:hypothetical protein